MGRLRVQHCVLNMTTRQCGPHPTSDLLGVDYFRTVPADTEFPYTLGRVELFVRFFASNLAATRIRITVSWLNPDGTDRRTVYRRHHHLSPTNGPGWVVDDRGFKLLFVVCPGEGKYAVRVWRRSRRGWQTGPDWRLLATEYFSVTRGP